MFKAILGPDHQGKGNPKFEDIDIVNDYPSKYIGEGDRCDCGAVALAGQRSDDPGQHRVQIILCPPFFKCGTFQGGPNREWPGIHTPECSNIAYRVSEKMDTLGSLLLHEDTHVDDIVQPPLSEHVRDDEYGYYDSRNLALTEPDEAMHNSDSYASFAAELTWSKLCNRDFAEPVEEDRLKKRAIDFEETPDTKETDATEIDITNPDKSTETDTKTTDTKRQEPRRDIQLASSLHKRTAFSMTYDHPILNTNVDNTYTVQQMDQYLQSHIDAMAISLIVIEQATCDRDRFDRIFRQYFKPEDRRPVLGKSLLRWQ